MAISRSLLHEYYTVIKAIEKLTGAHRTCSRVFHEIVGLNRQGEECHMGTFYFLLIYSPPLSLMGMCVLVCFVLFFS